MRYGCRLFAIIAAVMLNGCTAIVKEVRHPGGYPGHLLDKRSFDASRSKKLALLRYTIVLAMGADMGRSTVSGQDADGFAQLLASATREINYAAADVYGTDSSPCKIYPDHGDDRGCSGFYANFESNTPQIENRVTRVMLAALPTDKVRKFLEEAQNGNLVGAAWEGLKAVSSAVGGFHVAAARYRSSLEIVAAGAKCRGGKEFDESKDTVYHAAACLGLSDDALFNNPNELKGDAMGHDVPERAFMMLMRGIAADCVSLDFSGKGDELVRSQQQRVKTCSSIGFAPETRPYRIVSADNVGVAPIEIGTAPTSPGGDVLPTALRRSPSLAYVKPSFGYMQFPAPPHVGP